jgi:hypothetical protein
VHCFELHEAPWPLLLLMMPALMLVLSTAVREA